MVRFDSCSADDSRQAGGLIVGEQLQSFKLHVATLQLPFVVLLEQQRTDEPRNGRFLRKTPTTSVRRLNSALRRSSGLVGVARHVQREITSRSKPGAKAVWISMITASVVTFRTQ